LVFITHFFDCLIRGYNHAGKNLCGNNDATEVLVARTSLISHTSTIKSIALGYAHTLILMANGEVLTCGDKDNGKIGRIGLESNPIPTAITPTGISKIAAGKITSYLLANDNTFYTFGDGSLGSLGIDAEISIFAAFPLIQNIESMTAMHTSVYLSTTSGVIFNFIHISANIGVWKK
jgi:alpha-tubulin suppressor-like RCC1 family protein